MILSNSNSHQFTKTLFASHLSSSSASSASTSSSKTTSAKSANPARKTLKRHDSEIFIPRRDSAQVEMKKTKSDLEKLLGLTEDEAEYATKASHQHQSSSSSHSMSVNNKKANKEILDWFTNNMPEAYFRFIDAESRLQHIRCIAAIKLAGADPEMTVKSKDGSKITIIRGTDYPGALADVISEVRRKVNISDLRDFAVFMSNDGSIVLNVFNMKHSINSSSAHSGVIEPVTPVARQIPEKLLEYAAEVQRGTFKDDPHNLHPKPAPYFAVEYLSQYVNCCQEMYISNSSPRRFLKQYQMCVDVLSRGTEESAIDIEHNWGDDPDQSMITIALTNVHPISSLLKAARYLQSKKIDIQRIHIDVVDPPAFMKIGNFVTKVAMIRILTKSWVDPSAKDQSKLSLLSYFQQSKEIEKRFLQELPRAAKWLDDRVLRMIAEKGFEALDAEVFIALCDATHSALAIKDPYAYAKTRIFQVAHGTEISRQISDSIVKLFLDKAKGMDKKTEDAKIEELRGFIRKNVEVDESRTILHKMLDVVAGTIRTNVYDSKRYALGLRLSPKVLTNESDEMRKEPPFGTFFFHGRRFTGFHVRFADIARGGLRVVTPATSELLAVEGVRQYNECYDLAYAQQMKNKDIAEGGAKAVCLVDVVGLNNALSRNEIVRKSVRAMTNSMLDLLLKEEEDEQQQNQSSARKTV